MCADLGSRTIREELDALRVLGIKKPGAGALVVPMVLAATVVATFLVSLGVGCGLAGSGLLLGSRAATSPPVFAGG